MTRSAARALARPLSRLAAPVALAALGALAAAPLGAQDRRDDDRGRAYSARIDTTLALAANGTVELSLVAGEIVVTTGGNGRVQIRATTERGALDLDASPSRVSLDVRGTSGRGRSGDTRYEVTVPQGTRVIAQSTSGDIQVRGTRAEADLHSVSGNIVLEDAAGRAIGESVSGDVTVRGVAGNVRVESVSGDLALADVRGEVEAETVSGDLVLEGITSKWVSAETVSGEMRFAGPLDAGGRYDFTAHSGDIRLGLLGSGGVSFDVETFNGEIESDFPITLVPGGSIEGRPRRFEFAVGGGGARVSVKTFSGDIQLERGGRRAGQEDR